MELQLILAHDVSMGDGTLEHTNLKHHAMILPPPPIPQGRGQPGVSSFQIVNSAEVYYVVVSHIYMNLFALDYLDSSKLICFCKPTLLRSPTPTPNVSELHRSRQASMIISFRNYAAVIQPSTGKRINTHSTLFV